MTKVSADGESPVNDPSLSFPDVHHGEYILVTRWTDMISVIIGTVVIL